MCDLYYWYELYDSCVMGNTCIVVLQLLQLLQVLQVLHLNTRLLSNILYTEK